MLGAAWWRLPSRLLRMGASAAAENAGEADEAFFSSPAFFPYFALKFWIGQQKVALSGF